MFKIWQAFFFKKMLSLKFRALLVCYQSLDYLIVIVNNIKKKVKYSRTYLFIQTLAPYAVFEQF